MLPEYHDFKIPRVQLNVYTQIFKNLFFELLNEKISHERIAKTQQKHLAMKTELQ